MFFLSERTKSFQLYSSYIILFITRHSVYLNDNENDLYTKINFDFVSDSFCFTLCWRRHNGLCSAT